MPEWRYFNYPVTLGEKWRHIKVNHYAPAHFKKILESEDDILLLDTRSLDRQSVTRRDFHFKPDNSLLSGDYLAGAVHYPLLYLEDHYQTIPRDRKILITDWIMKQSIIAAKFLSEKGYHVVGILKGGTARWKTEGYPLVEGRNSFLNQLLCD